MQTYTKKVKVVLPLSLAGMINLIIVSMNIIGLVVIHNLILDPIT